MDYVSMNYMDLANSGLLYALSAICLVLCLVQCWGFIRIASKELKLLGVEKDEIKQAIKASVSVSILPSIPILISAFVMIPMLGVPLPWVRLSTVGAATFEMMSANGAAQSYGLQGVTDPGFNTTIFVGAYWSMFIAATAGLLTSLVMTLPISATYDTFRRKDTRLMTTISYTAIAVLLLDLTWRADIKGLRPTIATLGAFAFSFALGRIVKANPKLKILKEFNMAGSMLFGMFLVAILAGAGVI